MGSAEDVHAVLRAERDRLLGLLAGLKRDFASTVEAADSANADDEHDPEGATIAYERQQVAAHIGHAQEQLRQVHEALARLDAGQYGICTDCGRPVAAGRLAARPTASTCITCAGRRPR
jgi:DnaK suppressor protein